jgi:chaperonin cofactor prefoldin
MPMAAAQGMMTIERWLVRMATLEREETRLHREYVRLETQLHERLQGADHVLARGHT